LTTLELNTSTYVTILFEMRFLKEQFVFGTAHPYTIQQIFSPSHFVQIVICILCAYSACDDSRRCVKQRWWHIDPIHLCPLVYAFHFLLFVYFNPVSYFYDIILSLTFVLPFLLRRISSFFSFSLFFSLFLLLLCISSSLCRYNISPMYFCINSCLKVQNTIIFSTHNHYTLWCKTASHHHF
jgi:hypothetical protein